MKAFVSVGLKNLHMAMSGRRRTSADPVLNLQVSVTKVSAENDRLFIFGDFQQY